MEINNLIENLFKMRYKGEKTRKKVKESSIELETTELRNYAVVKVK